MVSDFTRRLTRFITARHRLDTPNAEQAALCVEDTVAVIYGGWHAPVVRRLAALDGDEAATPVGSVGKRGVERVAFLNAVAVMRWISTMSTPSASPTPV